MISVCIATYGGERFIKEQVDSILAQLSADDEIIISDDGSTDKTLAILASYQDPRVKVYQHPKDVTLKKKRLSSFYFATQNFEYALMHAKGDYVFLSDQDDVWKPNKLQAMLPYLSDYDAVMSSFEIVNEHMQVTNPMFWTVQPFKSNALYNIAKNPFIGCCMAFRKDFLCKVLPFPKGLMLHDIWLGMMSLRGRGIKFVAEPLLSYRKHGANVSATSEQSNNPIWLRLSYRIKMLWLYLFYAPKVKVK